MVVQTHLAIVLAQEEGQKFWACPDSNLAWLCPHCKGKNRHWYMGLFVPGGCAQQALSGTTAILEAAAGGASPVKTEALE